MPEIPEPITAMRINGVTPQPFHPAYGDYSMRMAEWMRRHPKKLEALAGSLTDGCRHRL